MGEHMILLGKRHFLNAQQQNIRVKDWKFCLPAGCRFIATSDGYPGNDHAISLFKKSEKIAQMILRKSNGEFQFIMEAVSSEYAVEVIGLSKTVIFQEK
ncbi:hypothetical protein JNUCC42_23025 [Brevibacterium sp. JNUCC-42]|uniref:Uncharacterized protein n=1 Tax=Brevibacillus laterosporus TaxID=1465 RepID=A0A502J1I7_BRELA|nr:hypothetical protein [Brevibacillus laterosporus]QOS99197.1 hypothetical protein JNUCC42_23025 [Brevibacterium sp. JNUCC-42]QDX95525.1 hypothetical protein EEL30_26625 [Brevibacillus laterosporus]RAP25771.1 hypothetical protein C2W64_02386 [Brevibacillus laterosporus]TPG69437.1 hypothetical protein EEL31_13570 [Brevibacillus laterosporus]TPG91320.1 hypothetical protein EEL32_02900 [Brevibacillus laterosporus]